MSKYTKFLDENSKVFSSIINIITILVIFFGIFKYFLDYKFTMDNMKFYGIPREYFSKNFFEFNLENIYLFMLLLFSIIFILFYPYIFNFISYKVLNFRFCILEIFILSFFITLLVFYIYSITIYNFIIFIEDKFLLKLTYISNIVSNIMIMVLFILYFGSFIYLKQNVKLIEVKNRNRVFAFILNLVDMYNIQKLELIVKNTKLFKVLRKIIVKTFNFIMIMTAMLTLFMFFTKYNTIDNKNIYEVVEFIENGKPKNGLVITRYNSEVIVMDFYEKNNIVNFKKGFYYFKDIKECKFTFKEFYKVESVK